MISCVHIRVCLPNRAAQLLLRALRYVWPYIHELCCRACLRDSDGAVLPAAKPRVHLSASEKASDTRFPCHSHRPLSSPRLSPPVALPRAISSRETPKCVFNSKHLPAILFNGEIRRE